MKHVITDDVDVNLNIELPMGDLADLVDKVVDGVVTVIAVATVAHIFRKWVT